MIVRRAQSKDAKAIAKVLVKSYNIKDEKEGIDVFKSESKKGHRYIVAEEEGEIVGIVTWLPHGLPKHGLAELDRIAVMPKMQGKGVAKQLKDALFKKCKEWYKSQDSALRKLYLLTHEDNARARKFYEKMGFSHETTLNEHYNKGRDECVYSILFEK